VVHARHDTTTLFLSLNSGAEGSVASGATTTLTGLLSLGKGTGAKLDGKIAEVVAYNRALTADEVEGVRNYLLAKYGLQ
jgi:hypothetical protein